MSKALLVLLALASPAAALRLAVTGASGYLGKEICHQAAAQGHSVCVGCSAPSHDHCPRASCLAVKELTD